MSSDQFLALRVRQAVTVFEELILKSTAAHTVEERRGRVHDLQRLLQRVTIQTVIQPSVKICWSSCALLPGVVLHTVIK